MNIFIHVLCFFLLLSTTLAGEVNVKKLPSLLGGSNAGSEFYFSFPPCYDEESPGGDNSIRVFVASGVRQDVILEVKGQGYRVSKVTVPNDVIEFRIPTTVGQPYLKRGNQIAPPEQVYREAAVHVKASAPIIVYGMTRYQYASDGFLAIPVHSLGTEYVVAAYPQYTAAGSTYELPSMSNIISAYDNTEVTFTMGGKSGSVTSGGLKKGQKATFSMNKGDVVCFANYGDAGDVSGSLIQSNKPIGVVSGNQCANVPAGVYACDYMCEMELPTFAWGKEYHVTPIVGRQKAPVIRVFAKEQNTKVFRDGDEWFNLPLADRGEGQAFQERRSFEGNLNDLVTNGGTPCKVISADKPIYVMQYNPGQTDDNIVSDPFQMVLTPLEQYQKEIVFATPNAKGGSLPFLRQFVNLIYENAPDGSIPDNLEFATVVNGQFSWKKVSVQFGPAPGFKFPVPIRGKNYSMKRLQLNGDGVFRIRANAPLAAYLYGFSSYDSYGFPTSMKIADLSSKDTLKPNPKWKVLCNGSVVGVSGTGSAMVSDKPDDPNVRSNLALIYMDLDSSENYTFSYSNNKEFIPGETFTTDWYANVIDPSLDGRANIIFVDRAGNDTVIDIRYSPLVIDVQNKDTDFGKIRKGDTVRKTINIVNLQKNSSAIIKNILLKNGKAGFTISDTTFPLTIPVGGKATLQVSFTNSGKGSFRDTLLIDNGCSVDERAIVKAQVGEPILSVSDIDFGGIRKGTKLSRFLTLKNEGDVPLYITGYSQPIDSIAFRGNFWPIITSQSPLILQPNETKQLSVEFTALNAKDYTDTIVFLSDALSRDSICILKGKGIEGGLLARGADWGRKRTGNGPYVDSKGIILENVGNGPIRILSSSSPDADFAFDKNVFNGMTLQPNQVIQVEAAFSPTVIGNDNLVVTFETDLGTSVPTDPPLRGAGIIGQLQTQDYDFDSTIIQGIVKPANRKMVRVTNIGTLDGSGADFSDDVTITDLVGVTAGSISETNASYGTEGFKYNKAELALPVSLKKGEYLEFQAEFRAQKPGSAMAEVQIESDASNRAIITKWTGFGIDPFRPDPQIDPKGGSVNNICVGSSGEITTTIKNIGNVKFPVLDVFINPATATEFVIDATSKAALLATNLELDETRTVKIVFSPVGGPGPRTAMMGIVGPTIDDTVYVDIVGVSNVYSLNLGMTGKKGIRKGDTFSADIFIGTAPSLDAKLGKLEVIVTYDSKVFSPIIGKIGLSGNYNNQNYRISRIDSKTQDQLLIEVESISGYIQNGGAFVEVSFMHDGIADSSISVMSVSGKSSGCVTVNREEAFFELFSTSPSDTTSNTEFYYVNKGNEIECHMNFESNIDKATLRFYNVKGQLMKEEEFQVGGINKIITYKSAEFSPGVYYIRLEADGKIQNIKAFIGQ